MKKFSWYTIVHPDWQEGQPPLFRLVGPAILPDEKTCDIYFKQNRKGWHTHNHIYNTLHRQKKPKIEVPKQEDIYRFSKKEAK